MKVRITAKSDGALLNKGDVCEVIDDLGKYGYMIRHKGSSLQILKCWCEVVEETEKSCDTCDRVQPCAKDYCKNNGFAYWVSIPLKRKVDDYVAGVVTTKQATGTTEDAKHYQIADIQPIEIMQKYLTPEEFIGAMKMQVIKYILRIGHKGSDREDASKCNQYSRWLCQAMDGQIIVPGGK